MVAKATINGNGSEGINRSRILSAHEIYRDDTVATRGERVLPERRALATDDRVSVSGGHRPQGVDRGELGVHVSGLGSKVDPAGVLKLKTHPLTR